MKLVSHVLQRALRLPPPVTRDLVVERDLKVPMPDGAVLLADRWAPRSGSDGLPTALIRCPYGRRGLVAEGSVRPLAERGYQVLIQSTRGGFGSGGTRVLDRIERFDATYSRFRPDSLALFSLYDRLFAATDGAVDPLVGRSLELLGYDASYSLTPAAEAVVAAECPAVWAADVVRDGPVIVTRRPLVIDVGAAGKGYLLDIVSALLREAGFTRFVVDGSGDLPQRASAPSGSVSSSRSIRGG